ncbi:MAG: hypothetical protein WCJ55_03260 [Chloroflexales bacterium]
MSVEEQPVAQLWWRQITEDWWAVIIGGALICLVELGFISRIPW